MFVDSLCLPDAFAFLYFQYSRFQQGSACSWMIYTLPPPSCLLPTHSLPSLRSYGSLFLQPLAFPLVQTITPLISWKLQQIFLLLSFSSLASLPSFKCQRVLEGMPQAQICKAKTTLLCYLSNIPK